jgi:RNA polymerase sigma factor (sigma-70 family)
VIPQQQHTIVQTVKRYGKQLFAFVRGRVATDEDAEDILQDVWYQLGNQAEIGAIEQVSGWLHRVARNKIVDRSRKKREDRLDDYSYEEEDGSLGFRDILYAEAPTPEDEDLKQLFWDQLFLALEELPPAQRDVFVQNELEERTLQEIADETGENIKTLISRKRYAVKHLRKRLENLYQEFLTY